MGSRFLFSWAMVETRYFTILPGRYVRTAIGVWLWRYGWIGGAVIAGFTVAGFTDARFFIVAAALALVAYPGIMMIVYFNHALTKERAYGVIPHKLIFDDTGIRIDYQPQDDHPTPPVQAIGIDEIANVEDTGTSMRITLISGKYDIIEIPVTAFNGNDYAATMDFLRKYMNK